MTKLDSEIEGTKGAIMATESAVDEGWDMGPPSSPPDIVDLMVQWFFRNFEDPAERTPHDEGEYVFIWGGPYYAHEELENAFAAVVTPEAITEAVAKIEEDGGPQWAPSGNRMRPETR